MNINNSAKYNVITSEHSDVKIKTHKSRCSRRAESVDLILDLLQHHEHEEQHRRQQSNGESSSL